MNSGKNKSVIGLTLGCRLNQADTALIFGRMEEAGFAIVKPGKDCSPDVIIVNTCTVTANAAQKSRQTARHFKRKYPEACLIVTGCDCDKALKDWEKEAAVDFALPNSQKKNIPQLFAEWQQNKTDKLSVEDVVEPTNFTENTFAEFPHKSRAFLKVQEGCNAYCTYCIVPYVRGPERSRAFDEVIAEAKEFVRKGHREIVVTGVNISTYKDEGKNILDLLEEILAISGDFRIRLSSMEPHPANKKLVSLIKDNHKMCRFMHVPLQSGSNSILKRMGRNYNTAKFAEFANFATSTVKGLHLGTDIITGFPGETDQEFQETCDFINQISFANMHIFRFSPREGTPAATFSDQVPQHVVKKRAEILAEIALKKRKAFIKAQIGQELPVLIEKINADGNLEGWSDNYIRIAVASESLRPGEIVTRKMSAGNFLSI